MMREYTGKERIMAAMRREYTDRVPIDVSYPKAHELVGFTRQECLVEPDKSLEAMIKAREMFPSDMVGVPGDPLLPTVSEATYQSAFGRARERKHLLEEKSGLAELKIRDPRQSKRYSTYLGMCEKVSSVLRDTAVVGMVPGPWSGAVEMRGAENIIYDTMDDPDFVHAVMRFSTSYQKSRALAIAETGVMVRIADPSAGCSLISPGIYKNFVKPYHQELIESIKVKGTKIILHICGYTDPIMEDIVSLGVDIIELDAPSSLQKMVEVSQKRVVISGNLAAELFAEGTKEEIEKMVKQCISIAAEGSGYILSPGCSVPYSVSLENMQHFWDAALKYGSYNA
ncbi:MAG: uroporphyrinogen decarboxylase family protein [Thermodesulfobacteriota bacterium]|nr:uroporphyrinogen decarboxylase family protein [Thermodesulfobacteriota bacterium]